MDSYLAGLAPKKPLRRYLVSLPFRHGIERLCGLDDSDAMKDTIGRAQFEVYSEMDTPASERGK